MLSITNHVFSRLIICFLQAMEGISVCQLLSLADKRQRLTSENIQGPIARLDEVFID